jgi:hypothetical protein
MEVEKEAFEERFGVRHRFKWYLSLEVCGWESWKF